MISAKRSSNERPIDFVRMDDNLANRGKIGNAYSNYVCVPCVPVCAILIKDGGQPRINGVLRWGVDSRQIRYP